MVTTNQSVLQCDRLEHMKEHVETQGVTEQLDDYENDLNLTLRPFQAAHLKPNKN